ncbi:MAG: hypothetical protein IT384_15890 [Deltaproteobacteria bacterium]|nr:hypothetical protein [Deltaproteobacteria bacterium]
MEHRWFLLLLNAAAGASCSDATSTLFVPLGADDRSLLLIARAASGEPDVFATDVDSREVARTVAAGELGPVDAEIDLFALRYTCSLEEMNLRPGWQHPVAPGEGTRLPKPLAIQTSVLRESKQSAWTRADLPAELGALRFSPARDGCTPFRLSSISIPETVERYVSIALPLPGDEVLIALQDGRFFRLTPEAVIPLAQVSTTTPHVAGFRRSDGRIWLLGDQGQLASGDLSSGFSAEPSLGPRGGGARSALTGDPAGTELFAITSSLGAIHHFDGQAWREVGDVDSHSAGVVAIAWVEPGRAIAISEDEPSLVHHATATGVTAESFAPPDLTGNAIVPRAVAIVPDVGVVVGADGVFAYDGSGWTTPERNGTFGTFRDITAVAALGEGMLLGNDRGRLIRFLPGRGLCDPEATALSKAIGHIIPLADRIVATYSHVNEGDARVAVGVGSTRPPTCDGSQ